MRWTRWLQHENPLGLPASALKANAAAKIKNIEASHPHGPNMARLQRGLPVKKPIAGVRHIVAVASGKGGVGKSTTTVNLAVAMNKVDNKLKVGILDADLFGPSIPKMMGLQGEPLWDDEQGLMKPLVNYGISCMSMGFLIKQEDPVVWRGLMVMKALEQLLRQVDWKGLDVLLVDMPPGTGDTQLTISQQIPLSGAVIVSTPQDVALADVIKGVNMFKKVQVPILGIVQNMSFFACPNCGTHTHVFGHDGCTRVAQDLKVDVLGNVPLHADVSSLSDSGQPIVLSRPTSVHSHVYQDMAGKILAQLNL